MAEADWQAQIAELRHVRHIRYDDTTLVLLRVLARSTPAGAGGWAAAGRPGGQWNVENCRRRSKTVSGQVVRPDRPGIRADAAGLMKFKDKAVKSTATSSGRKRRNDHASCSCGRENRRDVKRCPQCGQRLLFGMAVRRLALDAAALLALMAALGLVFLFDRGSAGGRAGGDALADCPPVPRPLRLAVTPPEYDDMGKLLDTLGSGYAIRR